MGSEIESAYVVERRIGSGAGGTVYSGRSLSDSQAPLLAFKVLNPDARTASLRDLEREALTLSKLRHPGLVSVYGFSRSGKLKDVEGPCFWMDLIDGRPLLEASRNVPQSRILEWFSQCLEALDYLHGQGVLHGDLKPTNILIDAEGRARLIDFGFSSVSTDKNASKALTGSLPYLAPELLSGRKSPASDLYALGVSFYETVAGRLPREGLRSLRDLLTADFVRLESLKTGLPEIPARLIDRLIETDLNRRFKTAREALAALRSSNADASTSLSFHSFRMFGREKDWETAENFSGRVILVHGPTGVGKSRFARELAFERSLTGTGETTLWTDGERLNPERRQELHRRLTAANAEGLLIVEYNDDGVDKDARQLFNAISENKSVLTLKLETLKLFETEALLASL